MSLISPTKELISKIMRQNPLIREKVENGSEFPQESRGTSYQIVVGRSRYLGCH